MPYTPALCLDLNASHFSTFHISIHFLCLSNNHAACLNPSARFISLQVSELPGMKWHEAGERDVIIHSPRLVNCQLWESGKWWRAKAWSCVSLASHLEAKLDMSVFAGQECWTKLRTCYVSKPHLFTICSPPPIPSVFSRSCRRPFNDE